MHVLHSHELDKPCQHRLSPPLPDNSLPVFSDPLSPGPALLQGRHKREPQGGGSGLPDIPNGNLPVFSDPLSPGPELLGREHAQDWQGTGTPEDFDQDDVIYGLDAYTMHGLALDSDPMDQIYDDWSGRLADDQPGEPSQELRMDGLLDTDMGEGDLYEGLASGNEDPMVMKLPEKGVCEGECCLQKNGGHGSPGRHASWMWRTHFHGHHCLSLGAAALPSMKLVKDARDMVLDVAGAAPEMHDGKQGHVYCINNVTRILQHDSGSELSKARQGCKWFAEVDGNLGGPMAWAKDGQDYFVEEPALAQVDREGSLAMVWPTWWFMRAGGLWEKCYCVMEGGGGEGCVVDLWPPRPLDDPW
ncbi:hypothetical protein K439DRAFT_1620648 [Ramaria rubella]|nr:hypothetical protein K439DRAFT_1620648 [Ramaria rubella]